MKMGDMATRANRWLTGHWQLVMYMLMGIIVLQQCSINSLQSRLVSLEQQAAKDSTRVAQNVEHPDSCQTDTTQVSKLPNEAPTKESEHSNMPLVVVLLLLAGLGSLVWYMKRNGIFPVGLFIWGSLKQDKETGELRFKITIINRSQKPIDVSDPIINFMMGSCTRKFRATVNDLPMTLQPGTRYANTINLTGLVARNLELMQSRAINMSIFCNEKQHSTLPIPVRFQEQ